MGHRYQRYDAAHPHVLRVIDIIRSMAATDGKTPTRMEYDKRRGDAMSSVALNDHGWSWSRLAAEAGLRPNVGGNKKRHLRSEVPVALEAEIQAAFERGDNLPMSRQEWPLRAIPTRVEVRDIPLPDGSVYRVTSYYASIR